jgi:uncharacterized protein YbaR (Trm112 family)
MITQAYVDETLRCPIDPSRTAQLLLEGDALICQRCQVKYVIKDGIPNMLPEDAELPAGCESISQLPCQRESKQS